MKSIRKIEVYLLIGIIFVVANGCSRSNLPVDSEDMHKNLIATEKQEITYVVNYEADQLDPGMTSETYAGPMLINAFEGLVHSGPDGEIVPAVAEHWQVNPEGTVYTFFIRNNAKWSNGDPLTAYDFVYGWKRVLTPAFNSYNVELFYPILNAEAYYYGNAIEDDLGFYALDDYTFVVELENPSSCFLQMISRWAFFPVHKKIVEDHNGDWFRNADTYICNGPFKPKDIRFGDAIVLVKNPYYWDVDHVMLDQITLRLINETSTGLIAMEMGQVDGIYSVPSSEIQRLKLTSDELYMTSKLSTFYILMNHKLPVFQDIKVRKALSAAIDRQQLCDDVLQGGEKPAFGLVSDGFVYDGKDFREVGGTYGITPYPQIKEAQALLADAGYPNGEGFPVLTFKYWTSPVVKKTAESLQQMWKKNLNIDVKILNSDFKVFFDEVSNADYELATMGWGVDYEHPRSFLDILQSQSPNNLTLWKKDLYDDLIRQSRNTRDEGEVLALLHQAEGLMMDEQVIIPVFQQSNVYMIKSTLKNWQQDLTKAIYFKNAYIEHK